MPQEIQNANKPIFFPMPLTRGPGSMLFSVHKWQHASISSATSEPQRGPGQAGWGWPAYPLAYRYNSGHATYYCHHSTLHPDGACGMWAECPLTSRNNTARVLCTVLLWLPKPDGSHLRFHRLQFRSNRSAVYQHYLPWGWHRGKQRAGGRRAGPMLTVAGTVKHQPSMQSG